MAERPGVLAIGPTGAPPGLEDYASVGLLIQRACAVFAEFRVTGVNAPAVAQICRALDGMPLAIELAAARLRTMTPEQVAARLDDRFQLLTGGSRTAMPRHQTLRAVVDWSWDLLDEPERLLWCRFSVFTGGATLEAVVQVCAGHGIGADQVLDLVTALTDKSLLTVRYGPDGARYRMLEIIRAYGQERLAEAEERHELRRAHAEYFTRLAEIGSSYLLGDEQLDWLRKLSDDQDNLHAAIRGAIAAGDGRAAVRLAAALGWYWWLRSMKVEGADLIAEAVGLPRGPAAEQDSESLAVAYAMGALLAIDTPVAGRAQDWFRLASELAAGIPDPKDHVLRLIGPLSALFGAFQNHGSMLPSVFDEAVADPEPWVSAVALVMRGHVTVNFGRQHVAAEEDFLAATGIFSGLGERWGLAIALSGLAMLEGWRGEHAAAADHYRRAIELAAEIGSAEDEVHFRLFLAREIWLLGDRAAAYAELARAQHEAERLKLPEVTGLAAYTAGDLARLDGEPEVARAELTRALELGGPPDVVQQLRAVVATSLGYLAAADADLDAARAWHAQAVAAAMSSADAPVIGQALTGLADLALHEADPGRAAQLLGAATAIRGTTDRTIRDDERVACAARAELGDAGFEAAYQRGQCATMDTLASLVPVSHPVLERPHR